jgi:hypothetical protein
MAQMIDLVRRIGVNVEQDVMERMKRGDMEEWMLLTAPHLSDRTEDGQSVAEVGYRRLPYWVCKPYIRASKTQM